MRQSIIFFYRVQGRARVATKFARRFLAEHSLWPNTYTLPSLLIIWKKGSMKTLKNNEYNWQSALQFQTENR
jgi:hypothetical protein